MIEHYKNLSEPDKKVLQDLLPDKTDAGGLEDLTVAEALAWLKDITERYSAAAIMKEKIPYYSQDVPHIDKFFNNLATDTYTMYEGTYEFVEDE